MNIEIKEVRTEETLNIRHQVLWPDKPIAFVRLPEDDIAVHFGLFLENQLVSVISIYAEKDSIRFRKFATLPDFQNRGLGKQLLNYVIEYARINQYRRIWCDARTSALGFYEKLGFEKFSQPFFKEDVEYYKIERNL